MNKDAQLNLLCVDDEAGILSSLTRLLRSEKFGVITASSGAQALEILADQPVQVLVADQRMPDMSGIALIEQVKQRHPHIVRVVLSGFADISIILESINKGEVFRYLGKPWNDEELKTMLRQCFAQFELEQENKQLLDVVNQQNLQLEELNGRLEQRLETQLQDLNNTTDNLHQVENGLKILHGIVQSIPLPLFGIDDIGQIVMANSQAIALAGEQVAIGNLLSDVVGPDVESRIRQQLVDSAMPVANAMGMDNTAGDYIEVDFGRVRALPLAINTIVHGGIVIIAESAAA